MSPTKPSGPASYKPNVRSLSSEKNKKNLNFVSRKCLKAISSEKTKILTKTFQRKNINFWKYFFKLLNINTGLGCFILTTYQFNSQSMGRPDKRRSSH